MEFVALESTSTALSTRETEEESKKDPKLIKIYSQLQTCHWNKLSTNHYLLITQELASIGYLMRMKIRFVVPESPSEEILALEYKICKALIKQGQ